MGLHQIVEKFQSEKVAYQNSAELSVHVMEDLSTRVFLSHKRSTGQGIAGRLFEGLKDKYKVFLDSVHCITVLIY